MRCVPTAQREKARATAEIGLGTDRAVTVLNRRDVRGEGGGGGREGDGGRPGRGGTQTPEV